MHRDFDSLEKLANHLKELMINDELDISAGSNDTLLSSGI